MSPWARAEGEGILLSLKVVPGGARDQMLGPHGERLRVKVAQPAEGGRANRALLRLLARRLGLPERALVLTSGAASPRKTVRVDGLPLATVLTRLSS